MPISPGLHVAMLVFVGILCGVALLWGWRARKAGSIAPTSRRLGVLLAALWIAYNLYYFHPAIFDWAVSLPLHACDVIAVVGAVVLIWPTRLGRAVLYFSAIGLTTQALITPTGNQDPATARFWLYWTLHASIVAASLFDIFVRGYRPTVKDFGRVLVVDLVYFSTIFTLNVIQGWNYGYLGNGSLQEATLLDVLGPWPLRALVILGLTVFVQFVMLFLGGGFRASSAFQRKEVS